MMVFFYNLSKGSQEELEGDLYIRRHESPDGHHPEEIIGAGSLLCRELRCVGTYDFETGRNDGE